MADQDQNTQEAQQPKEPIVVTLSLNLDQVNFILGALGKLPTESGAWIVRSVVGQQAQQQVDAIKAQQESESTSETTEEITE